MKRRLLARPPSPAMLVAVVALVSSLTIGAVAATKIDTGDIQNGAVTKKKLHKNAVNSKKVKNETLKDEDFAPGELKQGVQGIQGLKGDKGEKGEQGDTGPIGPSTGYGASDPGAIVWNGSPQVVQSLGSLPAGDYVVNGKVLANNNGGGTAVVDCNLLLGDTVVDNGDLVRLGADTLAGERLFMVQAATVTLDAVGVVAIQCDAPTATGAWANRVLTAIKVGEIG